MDAKPYLDYLDKEMTIMGILSGFCVAAPAGILTSVLGKDPSAAAAIWAYERSFVASGSFLSILAAFFFYYQRSDLAYYYGQLSYISAMDKQKKLGKDLPWWLETIDSWGTWWPYTAAFTLLITAFLEYFAAVLFLLWLTHFNGMSPLVARLRIFVLALLPLGGFLIALAQCYVRKTYTWSDEPWKDFFHREVPVKLDGHD